MSVDNRIPSEPYMELNGITVYAENDNKPLGRIKSGDGNIVAVELPDGRIVSVVDPEHNNPNKSFRFVGGTNEEKD